MLHTLLGLSRLSVSFKDQTEKRSLKTGQTKDYFENFMFRKKMVDLPEAKLLIKRKCCF